MNSIRIICILLLLLFPVGVLAASPEAETATQGRTAKAPIGQEALQRWQQLPPEEKERLRERYREYQQLPPEQQQRLRQNLERFRKMDPQQQTQLLERFRRWQQFSPERRENLRRMFRQYQQLDPEQQHQLRQDLKKLRELSPEEQTRRRQELRRDFFGTRGGMGSGGRTGGMGGRGLISLIPNLCDFALRRPFFWVINPFFNGTTLADSCSNT
jgi:hypothetical protein